jgi:lysozyme
MSAITPRVVDLSRHNTGPGVLGAIQFDKMAAAGIWGVIHKATQGKGYRDPTYISRRKAIRDAGLLFGAYHFATGDDVTLQVRWFLTCADPDPNTLLVLDYEDNRLSSMNIHQLVVFLRQIEAQVGRKAAIYSGNRLKETIGQLSASDRAYVCGHRLWLCQYGPVTKLPPGFPKWWLWQFTGDGIGPMPHSIAGVNGNGIDLNTYAGTQDQLKAEWA